MLLLVFHTGPPASVVQYSSVDKLPVRRKAKAETSADSEAIEKQSGATGKKPIPDEGALASVACSLQMKVCFWAARLAYPDLFSSGQSPSNESNYMDVQMWFDDASTHGTHTETPCILQ